MTLGILKPRKTTTSNRQGFTLIEMMVAVSIFVIVAFIVVSTLLTMSYAYKKAQKMRLLMDNLGFSLQSMSLNIREGINYNKTWSCDNPDGCDHISFKPIDSWLNGENRQVCFSYNFNTTSLKGEVFKCEDECPCIDTSPNLSRIISSPEIDIKKLLFIPSSSAFLKESVKIIIKGEAGSNEREKANFFIQTTVSQRNDDDNP